jgi:hydrophobic/amphiphilic exporter-1 (mainly G- bacteria), HAE1 family
MKLISGVIARPVTVTMFTLGVIVFGYFSFERLEVNLMPDISYPSITIRTEYEGAAPEEVEDLVSRPIEEALAAVRSLTQISSVSRAGSSDVTLELGWGTNLDQSILDIRQKLDLVELPEDATRPRILRYNPALEPIMKYGLYAEGAADLYKLRRIAEDELKIQLERIPGVAAAKVQGGLEEEVLIEADEAQLTRLGVSMELIQSRLAQENVNLAGGVLSHGEAEYLLRTTNEFRSIDEMGEIVLARRGQADIRLKDVARIRSAAKDRKVITRIGGFESVEIAIYKEADANTVSVSRRVKALLGQRIPSAQPTPGASAPVQPAPVQPAPAQPTPQPKADEDRPLAEELPPGVFLKLVADQARFIQQSIDDVLSAALQGGVLSILVLYLFLQELLPTLIISLAIPISIVATFAAMYFRGITLNVMSLGGLALAIGMLVDDAIVVLESIFRCREEGDEPVAAARRGTQEVFMAVVSTTLTTVAVFFPLSFVEGVAGQLFVDQALTVTFALLTSMAVSFTVVPMLAALQAPDLRSGGEGLWAVRLFKAAWSRATRLIPFRALNLPALVVGFPLSLLVELFVQAGRSVLGELRSLVARPPWGPRGGLRRVLFWLAAFLPFALLRLVRFVLRLALLGAARLLEAVLVVVLGGAGAAVYLVLQIARGVLWLPSQAFRGGYNALAGLYPRALGLALDNAWLVIGASVASTVGAGLLWSRLGNELVPNLHQGEFSVSVKRPVGTALAETDRAVAQIERLAQGMPYLDSVYATVGVSSEGSMVEAQERENEAVVSFRLDARQPGAAKSDEGKGFWELLLPGREAPMSWIEDQAVAHLRGGLRKLAGSRTQLTFPSLFSFKTPVEVQIEGHNLEKLQSFSEDVLDRLRTIDGLEDLRSNLQEGYPEVQIRFDRDRMAVLGLDLKSVAELIRDKVQGAVPTRFSEVERKLDMRVRLQPSDRGTLQNLADLVVNPGGAQPIPLSAVASLEAGRGPSEIRRVDQARVAIISANVAGIDLGTMAGRIEKEVRRTPAPPGFSVEVRGQSTEMKLAFRSLVLALGLAIFLVYLIMASEFESFLQPLIILFTIPMGAIGVIVVLYLLKIPVSIMVYMGIILLAGVVVDNAIILVDYINLCRSRGMALREAIVHAGSVRLRPILMSSATTVLGVVPMALGLGEGAEMRMPLAVTIISGLSTATVLTLVIIPTIYKLISRDR